MSSSGPVTKIWTPKFGVCFDESTQSIDRCVLSSSSCGPSQIYKAPYEIDVFCTDPKQVEVGRCTSSLDDKRCGPSEASCGTKSPFYLASDPTCSLFSDLSSSGNEVVRTTYPGCSDMFGNGWQCILGLENECFEGERNYYAKWTSEWGPSCSCEDVPTGICYTPKTNGEDNNLTPDNSFCAVSRRDCPDGHFWMNARAFQDSESATYECRLCDGNKFKSRFESGACLVAGVMPTEFDEALVDFCAMEATACATNSRFVSSEKLAQEGLHCTVEQTKNWGICSSSGDPVECTNKASSCRFDFRFEVSDDCDIHGNPRTGLSTYFSYCAPRTDNDDKDWREIRCVWDERECDPSKERWEEARLPDKNNAWFNGCTCEDVYTGVCKEPSSGEYHCAVSPQACTDPASYVAQRNLKENGIEMECQLCAPRPSPPETSPPTKSPVALPSLPPIAKPTNPPPIPSPTRFPTRPAETPEDLPRNFSKGSELSEGAVAGIVIGSVVLCGILALTITFATRNRAERAPQRVTYPDAPGSRDDGADPEVSAGTLEHKQEPIVPKTTIT